MTDYHRIALFTREARSLLTSSSLEVLTYSPWDGANRHDMGLEERPNTVHLHSKELACLSCHVTLGSREEQVEHYKLDWHRYNLKAKMKGASPVDQEQFEKISGDLSSISGSESDSAPSDHTLSDDEDGDSNLASLYSKKQGGGKSPYLYFSVGIGKPIYSIFRSIVTDSHSGMESSQQLCLALRTLETPQVWIILLRSGGHFAGAVFRGSEILAHKTFHRYTVRAKSGTAQSVRDNQQGGHQPKSAGANLRRYNETALTREIHDLITSWSPHVAEASCIFIRTPKHGKGVFIGNRGSKAPFTREDPRLRDLPFPTRRPTFKEVKAAHIKLSTIYVRAFERENLQSEISRESGMQPQTKEEISENSRESGIQPQTKEEISENSRESGMQPQTKEVISKNSRESGMQPQTKEEISKDSRGLDMREREGSEEQSSCRVDYQEEDMANDDVTTSSSSSMKKKQKKKEAKKNGVKNNGGTSEDRQGQDVPGFIQQLLIAIDAGSHVTNAGSHVTTILAGAGLRPITELELIHGYPPLEQLNSLWNRDTILHMAAANGCSDLIPILMLYGADPSIRNHSGHTSYLVSKTKDVRDSFRRFMAQHPSGYDYDSALIPSPLTEEMERERAQKQAEKKKKKKARKQEKKAELEVLKIDKAHQQTMASLSEREKRALAAEQRMASGQHHSSNVCNGCGHSLMGVVPFERLDYKYCSMNCLKQHRTRLTSGGK